MANEAALVTVLDGYTNGNIKVAEHVLLDYVAYLESELGKLQDSNSAISEAHSYLALSYERLSRIYKYLGASEKMTKYINKRDHIIESSLKTGEKNNQNSYLKISKVVTFLDREYGLPWILPTDESLPSE